MTELCAAIISFPLRQPVAIFLLVLVIILVVPLVFNRLKIPYIVGMIAAGVLVGPYGFNLLERDASFEIFGQVGILYLMFLAAVEIDLLHLRRNLRGGLVFGLLSFLLPMAAGVLTSRWLLSASWSTSVLIASMYASHTLISYPIVGRFGLRDSRAAVVAICGTVVAVLLALVALAEVVSIREAGGFSWLNILRLMALTLLYVAVIGVTYPWFTRLFFRKAGDSVTQFIYVLAMVFVASLLAQLIGLEAILGSFYAGLVLNRFVPNRSALMGRIEFVGNAIFIPYFLIGMGMLINIDVIIGGWDVAWVAGVMIVTALGTKWLAAFAAQRALGMDATGRGMMFGLSAGKAAATIAATMVGYRYGIISEDMMNGAVLMILVCCLVATVVTERAARQTRMRLTAETLREPDSPDRRKSRQLVAVSNPVTAEGIMKLAILMRHPDNREPMTALFVRSDDDRRATAQGREALEKACESALAVDIDVTPVERFDMNVVAGLVNVIRERKAADLFIGMHRKSSIVDTFLGGMIEGLLGQTNKMVVMSRCFIPVNTIRRLMVAVPCKAEYETGFRMWVERVANLAVQLSCRVVFIAYGETIPYISGVLQSERYTLKHEFRDMESWDDFIAYSGEFGDDDLLVIVAARRTSISFSSDLENMPGYLERYFSGQNIAVVYPEQFGAEDEKPQPIDALSQTPATNPSPLLLSWRHLRMSIRRILGR